MTEKENPNFIERFTVRMPDGMREAVAERAKQNGRSMNSEIVQILDDALNGRAKSIRFDFEKAEPIEIENVDNPESIIRALTEFAAALAELNKKPT
jgi:hypothetical protein